MATTADYTRSVLADSDEVTEIKKKNSSNKTDTDEMERETKAELKQQRDEINEFFDHLEVDMDHRIEDIDINNQKTLTAAAITCDSIHDNLTKMKTDTDTKLKTGQKCELSIAMKNYKPRMEAVDKEFENLREESKIQRYALTSSSQIKEVPVIKNTTEICRLRTAKLVSEVNVCTDNEKETPYIWGLAVVRNHFLAVYDNSNNSVKVVDTRNMKVTCEMSIDSDSVRCITNVNDDQIAVFESDRQQKIQFLSVSKSGSLREVCKVIIQDGDYGDIVYKEGSFYAVCGDKVRVIDLQGKTVKTINIYNKSDRIAISPDNKTIYVTSYGSNTVTSMTLDGRRMALYQDEDLESCDITVDSDGLVYVLGLDDIHQLTEDCTKIQVLLEDVYGEHMTYCNAAKQLYVGLGDEVTVYQLE